MLFVSLIANISSARIYNPTDTATWMHMSAIKSNILRRMDSAPSSVKVSCVKFIQRVVQVQTPGQIADPRVSPCSAAGSYFHD